MNARLSLVIPLAVCVGAFSARPVRAQAPCSTTKALVDSARIEVGSVLGSESPLVAELRQEQGLPKTGAISPVAVVMDRSICARLATAFAREIPPGVSFAVLKVGPLYYARDPDQRRGTGIVTDSTFRVVLRLGVSIPTPPSTDREPYWR